jgi:hypothetical protein
MLQGQTWQLKKQSAAVCVRQEKLKSHAGICFEGRKNLGEKCQNSLKKEKRKEKRIESDSNGKLKSAKKQLETYEMHSNEEIRQKTKILEKKWDRGKEEKFITEKNFQCRRTLFDEWQTKLQSD